MLVPLAQGIKKADNIRDTLNISSILTTSDSAYSKTNLKDMDTMEKEDGDIDGPFDLAVSITEKVGDDKETQIAYFASASIFNDSINSMVSGTNYELLSASLAWMSIPSKSYDTTTLTVPTADINFWSIFVTGVLPVCILLIGFGIWMKRRKQ